MSARAGLLIPAVLVVGGMVRAEDTAGPDPKGKPTYKVGAGKYAVWYDEAGWHFRATAVTDGQQFTGKIVAVDGEFVAMKPYSTTAGRKKSGEPAPKLEKIKSKEFTVSFTLQKGSESGFDLKLDKNATAIKFVELKTDGMEAPESILIGSKGAHPAGGTFELPARPGKKN
jgi:hypothetical protein